MTPSPELVLAREVIAKGMSVREFQSGILDSGRLEINISSTLSTHAEEARKKAIEEQSKIIDDLRLKIAGLYGYADIQGMEFVKHIKAHLKKDEEVICKICGKTVEEIALEAVDEKS